MMAFSWSAVAAWYAPGWLLISLFHVHSSLSSRQSVIDGSQHRRPVKRLAEEAANAIDEGPLLVTGQIAPSDQKHGQIRPHFLHESMKLKAVHGGHADIADEAADIGQSGVDQRLGRGEFTDPISGRLEQIFERLQDPRIVIDHRYHLLPLIHGSPFSWRGENG